MLRAEHVGVAVLASLLCWLSVRAARGDGEPVVADGSVKGTIIGIEPTTHPLVVFLDGDAAPAHHTFALNQQDLQFVPSTVVLGVGDTLDFPNNDNVTHNVFSVSPAKKFDLGLYKRGASKQITFGTVGHLDVFCNIHSNMHANIEVVPSGYFVMADAKGAFQLDAIPRGKHSLVIWR